MYTSLSVPWAQLCGKREGRAANEEKEGRMKKIFLSRLTRMCVDAGSTTFVFLTMASTISVVEMATPQQHDPFFSSSSFPLKTSAKISFDHSSLLPFPDDHSHALHVLLDFVPLLGIVLLPYPRIYVPKLHSAHGDARPEGNCERTGTGMIGEKNTGRGDNMYQPCLLESRSSCN